MIPTMRREAAARVVALVLLAGLGSSLAAAVAHAADFGGECCAELEERVAEFEATTVQRGNEKLSLRLSGYCTQQLLYWNDGVEDNVYLSGLGQQG